MSLGHSQLVDKPIAVLPLSEGTAVVDIGINQVDDGDGDGGTRIGGDADSCRAAAGWITPEPGAVGPVTVSTRMRNVAKPSARMRHDEKPYGGRLSGPTRKRARIQERLRTGREARL